MQIYGVLPNLLDLVLICCQVEGNKFKVQPIIFNDVWYSWMSVHLTFQTRALLNSKDYKY